MTRSVSAPTSMRPRRPHVLRISPATWMLSRTVREVKSSSRWYVRARPRRARAAGPALVTSCPSMRTRPDRGSSSPLTTLNSVVLPAPLGPMRPVTPPSATERETSLSTWAPPKATETSVTSRTDIGHTLHRGHRRGGDGHRGRRDRARGRDWPAARKASGRTARPIAGSARTMSPVASTNHQFPITLVSVSR